MQKKKREPSPKENFVLSPDFDIEYAKLIAKQFPIYDENDKVIDYSNINEYQLELLALHEEYGEEKDPKKKYAIFHKLSRMDEKSFYESKQKNQDSKPSKTLANSVQAANSGSKKPRIQNYGPNVGKDGGNPDYKKNVIQLEQERYEMLK